MPIRFSCTHCNKTIKGPDQYAGVVMNCPACGESFQVPPLEELRKAEAARKPAEPAGTRAVVPPPGVEPKKPSSAPAAGGKPAAKPAPAIEKSSAAKPKDAPQPSKAAPKPAKIDDDPFGLDSETQESDAFADFSVVDDDVLPGPDDPAFADTKLTSIEAATAPKKPDDKDLPGPGAGSSAAKPSSSSPSAVKIKKDASDRSPPAAKSVQTKPRGTRSWGWLAGPGIDVGLAVLAVVMAALVFVGSLSTPPAVPMLDLVRGSGQPAAGGATVFVAADETLRVGSKQLSGPTALANELRSTGSRQVLIVSSRDALYDTVRRTIAAAGLAGAESVQLAISDP